jgi:hypothetical protein
MVVCNCHSTHAGSVNRRTVAQAGLGLKQDPIFKITKAKRTGGIAQVAEHLPSKLKALSSNHGTAKKINKKRSPPPRKEHLENIHN